MRPQAKHASYIAIKSAPDTYFLRHSYFIPRRALPLFKYHGTISCPTSVLTMPSLRLNARASNSKRCRNSHAKVHRPKNQRLPDSPEIFFQSAQLPSPSHDGTRTIFPGTFVFVRALPTALLQDPEPRINFILPLSSFPQPLSRSLLETAMYREQWKWLSATLNPGKASLIRHQKQNQRHRRCCNSRVNSPPCARNTKAAETRPLITGVSQND